MADEKKVSQAAPLIHIDEFLKGVKDESATIKGMFKHFLTKVNGIEKKTEDEFKKLFAEFKDTPASDLK